MFRVGVIGCTGIGIRHAAGFAAFDDLSRLSSSRPATWRRRRSIRSRSVSSTRCRITGYANHREMLEKENLDIVTVATSDHARAALVVDAAEAGVKRIFCEKSLARTVEDADPMVSACERHNVILSIDHTRRWTPI